MIVGSASSTITNYGLEDEVSKIKKMLQGNYKTQGYKQNSSGEKKVYRPKEDDLKRWKTVAPTEKTLKLLGVMGATDEQLREIKTQYDAHIILEELKSKEEVCI